MRRKNKSKITSKTAIEMAVFCCKIIDMSKYWLITYGCQMNKSDSKRIAATFERMGLKPASKENEADLIVVNMCSVRQSAVDRVYGLEKKFKELKKKNKNLKTLLTGCISNLDFKKFQNFFDYIFSIKTLSQWPQFLKEGKNFYYPNPREQKFIEKFKAEYLKERTKYSKKFSVFIPISSGCDNFCSFCIVPYVRGPLICRPHQDILKEVKFSVENGAKEIWLLGQNVNDYESRVESRKLKVVNFAKLLKMVNDIPGIFWIRFTSPHPKKFSDELIETMAKSQKVTPYLNLPVQSGDNEVLKRMNRPYIISQYKNLVKKIKEKIPEIALSTDVIVGFPGETKEQFENTAKLLKEIKFDMAYIARYSPRPGAAAAKLKDDVLPKEKERRYKILTEILKETALEKNKKYIGKEVEVLVESRKSNVEGGNYILFGKTRTYKTVKLQTTNYKLQTNLVGQFVKVKIIDALPWGLKGKLI